MALATRTKKSKPAKPSPLPREAPAGAPTREGAATTAAPPRSKTGSRVDRLAAELALINRIQQGMAARLGFQAIVDLVGDTLRAMFDSEDLSIRWWDPEADTVVQLYSVEHGKHLPKGPPVKVRPTNKPLLRMLREGVGAYLGTRDEQLAAGVGTATPGTDWCLSIIGAPIRGAERVLGIIVIENHAREHAFGEADVRRFLGVDASEASVERARNTAMMMASPTAASAAATIMTKKTKIWPFTSCH